MIVTQHVLHSRRDEVGSWVILCLAEASRDDSSMQAVSMFSTATGLSYSSFPCLLNWKATVGVSRGGAVAKPRPRGSSEAWQLLADVCHDRCKLISFAVGQAGEAAVQILLHLVISHQQTHFTERLAHI